VVGVAGYRATADVGAAVTTTDGHVGLGEVRVVRVVIFDRHVGCFLFFSFFFLFGCVVNCEITMVDLYSVETLAEGERARALEIEGLASR
jgi:hypothetical protein